MSRMINRITTFVLVLGVSLSIAEDCKAGDERRARAARRREARLNYLSADPITTGPTVRVDLGTWAPVAGPWEELLKAGTNFGIGYGTSYPPNEDPDQAFAWNIWHIGYRHAHLRGDRDVQLFSPTFVGEVENLDLHLIEGQLVRRFESVLPFTSYLEVGAGVGIGGADGEIVPAVFNPAERRVRISSVQEDALFVRGELIAGAGYWFRSGEVGFRTTVGHGVTQALLGRTRGQTDIGVMITGTIYLDELSRRADIWRGE